VQQKEKKEEEKNLIKKIKIKPIITQQKSKKMNLKELQSMIKEEFDNYMGEADDLDVAVSDADVDVDAEMGDEMGAGGEEDVLRKIYDLLAAHFEGGEEAKLDDDGDLGDLEGGDEDVEETYTEDEGADLEEGDGYNGKVKGSTKGAPYTGGSKSTKNAPYTASSKALQERFQKLANIIK
jgi:hypothetical protein